VTPPDSTLDPSTDVEALWRAVAARLQETLARPAYAAWFGSAAATGLTADGLQVAVPNEFTRAWITGHLSEAVEQATTDALGTAVPLQFVVADRGDDPAPAPRDVEATAPVISPPVPSAPVTAAATPPAAERSAPLNRHTTFDSFVIGPSNRFAHAAALAVAESPSQSYNPLFIYGATGLGKTHLLQAIVHYTTAASDLRAHYVTCETFTNEFIEALRAKRIDQFKQRYRRYDVLLVDDIQFLSGREGIQEEFFHTFNTLYEAGNQIVLSSDRPPRDIAKLEDRLRSRFEWGLITDVQAPDLETRIAILRKKCDRDRLVIGDDEVLAAIAMRVQSNIRELEGALTRSVAFAALNDEPLTVELVRNVLATQYPEDARPVTVEHVQRVVAEHFGVTISDLVSQRRTQAIVYPRQLAMYLSRELTDLSLPRIGTFFGGRDHTTIHYGHDKIARQVREDREVYNLIQDLTSTIRRLG
jgi:chromosomal replication initiator protein